MASRKLVLFEHATPLGNAPAHKLFDLVRVTKLDASKPARAFADYEIKVNYDEKPAGVVIVER